MYRIALCDDETMELDKVENLLEVYGKKNSSCFFEVKRFESAEELLMEVEEGKYEPDLVLLDIYMKGKLGTEAAKQLRVRGMKCLVVFLTVSREHALDAFGVDAAQYLLKPVTEGTLFPVLDKVFGEMAEAQKKYLLLEGNGKVYRVALRDIVYCEAQRKMQCIYMANGASLMLRMTMTKIYEKLSLYSEFVKVGVAYIVNLEHIENMNTQELQMDNGDKIYLPRGAHRILRGQYFDYYCEEK